MKAILFFDGCGTLWYPRRTRRTANPLWVYRDPATAQDPDRHLMPAPDAAPTLRALRARGIRTVLLSTSPHPPEAAQEALRRTVAHLGLASLLDELHATAERHSAKGERMAEIIGQRGLTPGQALMVGDRYVWDYAPAQERGIPALLLASAYEAERIAAHPEIRTIAQVQEVLGHV